MLEAPLITESALEVIRKYCEDEVRTGPGHCSLGQITGLSREGSEGHTA